MNTHLTQTAGKLMTGLVPVVGIDARMGEVAEMLYREAKSLETIAYIFVVKKNGVLAGVISVKDVFRLHANRKVSSLIKGQKIFSVRAHTDQEHVVRVALKYGIKSVPVIDKKRKFLGVVTHKTILKIMEAEHIEDLLLGAGITAGKDDKSYENFVRLSSVNQFRKRLPWLVLGLLGGIVTAFVVNIFEESLREEIIFASFIPLVVYIADAVGVQTQTIFIRAMVVDKKLKAFAYFKKEGLVTFGLAICLGLMIAAITIVWQQSEILGLVIGLSVFSTIVISSLVAIFMPWFFDKIKIDPAVASGPFATVIRDITSLMVYFGIANLLYFRVFS